MAGKFIRSFRWLIGYQMVRLLVGFFLGTWVARVLGPDNFGVLATATAAGGIAYCFVELGMRQFVLREIGRRRHSGAILAGTVFKLWLALGFVGTSLLAVWNVWSQALPWGVFIATAVPMLLTAFSIHNNWEEAENRAYVAARNNMGGYLGAAALRVVCVLWLPTMVAIAWTFTLETVIALALGMWVSHMRRRGLWLKGWNPRVARSMLSRGAVLVVGQAGMLLLLRADTVMVEHMQGSHEAGIYGAAVRLSELVYFFCPMLSTMLLPRLAQLLKSKDEPHFREMASRGSALMAMAGLASALGLMLLGPTTIRLLFGSPYEASVAVLMIHSLAAVPYFQMEWRYTVMVASDRARVTAWLSWAAVLLNIGLNLLWIPQHGALGAAWATLISYGACGMAGTWLVADLRWFAKSQLVALLAPFDVILRPRHHMTIWKQMLARTSVAAA